MPNANWSNPTLTSTYTNFVTEVNNRDEDLALQFDGTTSTNIPTNTIRWDSAANRWKKWNGSSWAELTGTYALTALSTTGNANIGGTLAVTAAATLSGTLAVTGAVTGSSTVSGTALVPTAATVPTVGTFLPAANTVAIATASTERVRVGPAGQVGVAGANYGTAGQVLTSAGASAAPSWQTPAAAPSPSPAFPSGTVMLFQQTAAPTGWTKITTHNNKALRVVNGTASSGGTTGFTTVFASRTPGGSLSGTNINGAVSATTLTTAQMPSHSHTLTLDTIGSGGGDAPDPPKFTAKTQGNYGTRSPQTSATGGGGSHTHGFTNPTWSGSFTGAAMNFAVQYVDVIFASKD
jgi:hypothetical protein